MKLVSSVRPMSLGAQITSAPSLVALKGVDAEVLLPSGASWARYAKALTAAQIFPGPSFEALAEVQPGRSDPKAPRIGILISEPSALHGALGVSTLIKDVRTMGAVPLLIPPCADLAVPRGEREAAMAQMISALDALIGPGGADVAPAIYNERLTHSEETNEARDRFEADFALRAMASNIFLFGICRSHQLWNAARDGALIQDLQKDGINALSQRQTEFGLPKDRPFVLNDIVGRALFEHRVDLLPTSAMASIVGANQLLTNSFHHQAVRVPGRGLAPVGFVFDPRTSTRTIEASEAPNVLTTQWHPELMPEDSAERRLLESVGRRAHIVKLAKGLGAAGERSERALIAHMKRSGIEFDRKDYEFAAWLNARSA